MNDREIGWGAREGLVNALPYLGWNRTPHRLCAQVLEVVEHVVQHAVTLLPEVSPVGGVERVRGVVVLLAHAAQPSKRHADTTRIEARAVLPVSQVFTMDVHAFHDPNTSTLTYVVHDTATRDAVVIDPVLDFDPTTGRTYTRSADEILAFVNEQDLTVRWILETHAHADHLSASWLLKRALSAPVGIGARITEVQATFKGVLELSDDFRVDGGQFDRLLRHDDRLEAGRLRVDVIATPGHTPACLSFRMADAVFTGDALFIEDFGTGRCDFPAASAESLYDSVHDRLYSLPDATRVFVGHDYRPGGRALRYETTIGRSKADNVHLRATTTKESYVKFRHERDATLPPPRLLLQSIERNINGGVSPRRPAVVGA